MIQNGAINDKLKKDGIKFSKEFIDFFQNFNNEYFPAVNIK